MGIVAAASCAVFAAVLFVGCQSNGQYDQVARELRMQEDELYALEDYLDQYQKLVCQVPHGERGAETPIGRKTATVLQPRRRERT